VESFVPETLETDEGIIRINKAHFKTTAPFNNSRDGKSLGLGEAFLLKSQCAEVYPEKQEEVCSYEASASSSGSRDLGAVATAAAVAAQKGASLAFSTSGAPGTFFSSCLFKVNGRRVDYVSLAQAQDLRTHALFDGSGAEDLLHILSKPLGSSEGADPPPDGDASSGEAARASPSGEGGDAAPRAAKRTRTDSDEAHWRGDSCCSSWGSAEL